MLAYEELDTFSFTISHDLRSPLSSIRNYCELLSGDDADFKPPEKQCWEG
jgi:chemotaxis family two-component system sensor kinase Cph1